jgi:hypothetical protein
LFVLKHEGFYEGFETSKGSSRLKRIEATLGKARFYIREAGEVRNFTTTSADPEEYVPEGPIYKNPNAFHRYFLSQFLAFFDLHQRIYKFGILFLDTYCCCVR